MTDQSQNNMNKSHTISILVANKPGVLVRVSLVFAKRGYNIDALVVSPAYNPKFSRMTITAQGDPYTLDQIIKQTSKLIDVVHVCEHNDNDAIHKELALLKVKNTKANNALITKESDQFNLKIISTSEEVLIFEQTGTTDDLNAFESLIKKSSIIEMVRSGKLVMALGSEET